MPADGLFYFPGNDSAFFIGSVVARHGEAQVACALLESSSDIFVAGSFACAPDVGHAGDRAVFPVYAMQLQFAALGA